jgi:hypothetical protein
MHQGEKQAVASRFQKGLRAVVLAVGGLFASAAGADQLFDFTHDPIDPARQNPPLVAGFTPAPFLTNANQGAVGTYLAGAPIKAVKIPGPAPVVSGTLYSDPNTRPKYSFFDFEGANPQPNVVAQRNFINTSSGGAVAGNQIYVGEFNYYPVPNDPTRPAVVDPAAPSFQFPHSASNYYTAGLNMANEALYPGAPDLRSRANGNSTAPNIRSGFMTLPITRLSLTTSNLPTGHKHIPYVTRFNNYGNPAFDTDGNRANGYVWTANTAPAGGAQNGQLLSRGDFSALVAHYRARGADGVHLLDGGVVGYTRTQFENDAKAGWEFAPFQTILQGGGARLATLDTLIRSDGALKNIEDAGMVFSGVYSLTQNKLALLVSNLDEISHTLDIPQKIGGRTVVMGAQTILAGQHKLLEFTGSGTQWTLTNNVAVFTDNDRSGTGVPEPAVMGTLAFAGLFALSRRRQRA